MSIWAFPVVELNRLDGSVCDQHFGLTKRELFAAMAMQGMLAENTEYSLEFIRSELGLSTEDAYNPSVHWPQYIAVRATAHADALLAELAKGRP